MDQATSVEPVCTFTPAFDPLIPNPQYVRDPYVVYRALRENAPMYRSPHGVWIASRHREIVWLLKDARLGRGYFYFENLAQRVGQDVVDQPLYHSARNMMVLKDGAEHAHLRDLFIKSFSHRSIENMRPRIQAIMDKLVDDVLRKDTLDVMLDLAFPLPSAVICFMLGIPEADWGRFSKRSATGSRALEPTPLSPHELAEQNQSVQMLNEYFSWLIDLRRREPGDDLTSVLVAAQREGANITREDMIDNLRMIFIGGQETSVNTIGNGLLALYSNPDQLELLRAKRVLLSGAVVEMVRYDSSVQITPRQPREDIEVGETRIRAGETILCIIASANRDDEAYAHADRFDITRTNNYPLSFGGGSHYCTGAQLGKVEAEVTIGTILDRLPNLRPDICEPQWLPNTVAFRGLKTLPATWG